MSTFRRGENYEIVIVDRVVSCRVWQRPDLSREEGAKCAEEKAQALSQLASYRMFSLLFDLSAAPHSWGPTTHEALCRILNTWDAAGRTVVIVVGPEPIQKLTVRRLIADACPKHGKLALDLETGLEMARTATRPGSSEQRS
jgi:hypothetical protein